LASGDLVMCRYVMTIDGFERVGGYSLCTQIGMMHCHFDRFNKIISMEMTFDVMGFMQQLQVCFAPTFLFLFGFLHI
jgi:hypothetical protein